MTKPYSEYKKQLLVYHHCQGFKSGDVSRILQEEGIMASSRGIGKFLAKFIESGSVARKLRSGRLRRRQPRFRRSSKKPCADNKTTAKAYIESSVRVSFSALLRFMLISTYTRNREKAVLTFMWKKTVTLWLHVVT